MTQEDAASLDRLGQSIKNLTMTVSKKNDNRGKFQFDGWRPNQGAQAWPPKRGMGFRPSTLLKRFMAWKNKQRLVWLRDHDDTQTLSICREQDGVKRAFRYWPDHREVVLNDDGSCSCSDEKGSYIRQWIIADNDTEKVYMAMANSELYAQKMSGD